MNKIQIYDVAPALPPELEFLETLRNNMWWCWNSDAIELFRRIAPSLWKEVGHNPLRFFDLIPQKRLEALTKDEGFMAHYEQVAERFDAEVLKSRAGKPAVIPKACIAYFSLEYGIHESIRLYSGGLGVLAGDHLKAASDMDLPLAGVGLMYRCGYFQQFLNIDGWQQEACPENELHRLPVKRVLNDKEEPLTISVPMPEGVLNAIVWSIQIGRIPLYLLDTNIPENPPHFRRITWQLYEADRQTRLRQELLLGIGGFRALTAMGYDPSVCHINEGHAAFLSLERISHLVKNSKLEPEAAYEVCRRTNVFTTHTPVPAGNETFPIDLVRPHLDALSKELDIPTDRIISWGLPLEGHANYPLSMTILGLRTAEMSNGVSRLHGVIARKMWSHLWPGRPVDEVPIRHITNGVHVPSWLSWDNAALFDRYLGPTWRDDPANEEVLARIDQIPDEELWRVHETNRSRLIRFAREQGERQFSLRNATRAQIAEIKTVLHHDVLTIGFARRFAGYKRATLLLRDKARLEALLTNKDRPVQFIFAGKAHPADDSAKQLIQQIVGLAHQGGIRQRVIFLEDYDIRIARTLVQGVDVWLNTPRRPQEASGTSGMKAALNGAVNLSILDGWWDEGYTPEAGWAIGQGEEYDNPDYQDTVECQAIYNILENELIPRFYDRAGGEAPEKWLGMMKASIRTAFGYFTCHRMLSEYDHVFYRPALAEYGRLMTSQAEPALALVTQKKRLHDLWKGVKVSMPTTEDKISGLHVGDTFRVTATVHLGELRPDEVDLEIYSGPLSVGNQILESHATPMVMVESQPDGRHIYSCEVKCASTGRYGFTARVTPRGTEWKKLMPGFITWADGH